MLRLQALWARLRTALPSCKGHLGVSSGTLTLHIQLSSTAVTALSEVIKAEFSPEVHLRQRLKVSRA